MEYFGKDPACIKCGRGRHLARLCPAPKLSPGVGIQCSLNEPNEHLHWECSCGYSWVSWPKDNPHGHKAVTVTPQPHPEQRKTDESTSQVA